MRKLDVRIAVLYLMSQMLFMKTTKLMDMLFIRGMRFAQSAKAGHWRTIVKTKTNVETTKIFLITADYRNPPVTTPYAVKATTKRIAKKYFMSKFPWLKVYKVEEFIGDPNEIQWYW